MLKQLKTSALITMVLFSAFFWGSGLSFGQPVCAPQSNGTVTVDIRNWITQPYPGNRKKGDNAQNLSIDGYRDGFGEWITGVRQESDGALYIADYEGRPPFGPMLFGPRKNFDAGSWRCFSDPGESCAAIADYPPNAVPLIMGIGYRTTTGSIPLNAVTPGATLIPEYAVWRPFQVRGLNPTSCAESDPFGTIYHKVWASVQAVDIGGEVGCADMLLIEEGQAENSNGPMVQLEKYFYSTGRGRVREQSYDFRTGGSGVMNWNTSLAGDFSLSSMCPYNDAAW